MCKIMEDVGKEARKDERKQFALRLLAKGNMSFEEIAELTKLSVKEVKALAGKKTA